MLIEVTEDFKTVIDDLRRAILFGAFKAEHVVVDELGRGRIIADNDEAERNFDPGLTPLASWSLL